MVWGVRPVPWVPSGRWDVLEVLLREWTIAQWGRQTLAPEALCPGSTYKFQLLCLPPWGGLTHIPSGQRQSPWWTQCAVDEGSEGQREHGPVSMDKLLMTRERGFAAENPTDRTSTK